MSYLCYEAIHYTRCCADIEWPEWFIKKYNDGTHIHKFTSAGIQVANEKFTGDIIITADVSTLEHEILYDILLVTSFFQPNNVSPYLGQDAMYLSGMWGDICGGHKPYVYNYSMIPCCIDNSYWSKTNPVISLKKASNNIQEMTLIQFEEHYNDDVKDSLLFLQKESLTNCLSERLQNLTALLIDKE